jgi:hypothetical protein
MIQYRYGFNGEASCSDSLRSRMIPRPVNPNMSSNSSDGISSDAVAVPISRFLTISGHFRMVFDSAETLSRVLISDKAQNVSIN